MTNEQKIKRFKGSKEICACSREIAELTWTLGRSMDFVPFEKDLDKMIGHMIDSTKKIRDKCEIILPNTEYYIYKMKEKTDIVDYNERENVFQDLIIAVRDSLYKELEECNK